MAVVMTSRAWSSLLDSTALSCSSWAGHACEARCMRNAKTALARAWSSPMSLAMMRTKEVLAARVVVPHRPCQM